MKKLFLILLTVSILSLFTYSAQAAVQYTVTDIGDFRPTAMNSHGEVVGWSNPSYGVYHAVLYSKGVLQELGTFGGSGTRALGINDLGQVVGYGQDSSGNKHAFLYQNGLMTDLNPLIGSAYGPDMAAGAINNSGYIAGVCFSSTGQRHVFLNKESSVNVYDLPGAYVVTGINSNKQILGVYHTEDGYGHGFILNNGEKTDIGALDGNYSYATGINSNGTVVGYATKQDNTIHAFIYDNGNMTDMGNTGEYSSAYGINDFGQILGSWNELPSAIYDNGEWLDLNELIDPALGIVLGGGVAINNNGQIALIGHYKNTYVGSSFLLTPIPEPSTLVHICIFSLAILAFSFCKKF